MKLEVTVDLKNYTVNITNVPGMHTCHVCVRKAEGKGVYNILKVNDLPVREGEVTWVKLWTLHPHPDNGFHEGNFVAYVVALSENGSEIAEGDSEAFFLAEEQIQFIQKTYTANHPQKTLVEQPATSTLTVVRETVSITTERPAGGDLGIHIPEEPLTSPLSPHVEDAEGGEVEAGDETDEARNIQASPKIPPAITTDTDATPVTENAPADQPLISSAAPVSSVPTPSPEKVATYALKQMQKQLREKEEAHTKELKRVQEKKDVEITRLQNERATEARQAEELQRAKAVAEKKLVEQHAAQQKLEKDLRQRDHDLADAAQREKNLKHEITQAAKKEQKEHVKHDNTNQKQIDELKGQVAALLEALKAQPANTTPAPSAPQTTTATTPAPAAAPQPDQTANQTSSTTPAATASAATTEPSNGNHRRRPLKASWWNAWFRWRPTGKSILLIIALALVGGFLAWFLMDRGDTMTKTNAHSSTPEKEKMILEQARLQEEINRMKIEQDAATKVATPVMSVSTNSIDETQINAVSLGASNSNLTLSSPTTKGAAHASINMVGNHLSNGAKVENKIEINDNRQTIVHPNGWPLDWRPTLPVVVASDLPKGVSTFIIPLRGVQCIRVPVGWCIEPAMQDMAHIDVKYGLDGMCFDYGIGQPGIEVLLNEIRIRPKGHELAEVTVRVLITPP